MSETWAIAIVVASIAGCVVGSSFADAKRLEERTKMSPIQLCIEHALTQSDRIQCMQAKP